MDKAIEASLDDYFVVARRIAVRDDLGMPWRWFNDPIVSSLADELNTLHGRALHETALVEAAQHFTPARIRQIEVQLPNGNRTVNWDEGLRSLNSTNWGTLSSEAWYH